MESVIAWPLMFSNAVPYTMPAVENINGQAITLAVKHKDKRDPKQWKGFKFAVPFEFSMHNFLLRYYVAEAGLDPDRDIQIRVVPPPEMVATFIGTALLPRPRLMASGMGERKCEASYSLLIILSRTRAQPAVLVTSTLRPCFW